MAIIKDFIKYRRFLLEGNAVLFTWVHILFIKLLQFISFGLFVVFISPF